MTENKLKIWEIERLREQKWIAKFGLKVSSKKREFNENVETKQKSYSLFIVVDKATIVEILYRETYQTSRLLFFYKHSIDQCDVFDTTCGLFLLDFQQISPLNDYRNFIYNHIDKVRGLGRFNQNLGLVKLSIRHDWVIIFLNAKQ